jgi:hypothetical protein
MTVFDEARLKRGRDVARTIVRRLRSSDFLHAAYPHLFEGKGVAEGSFHSYMLSALLLLGDRLGYSAVVDSPIFDRLDNLLLGEGSKRPDSIWFERGTETVRVLIEFERYTASSLSPKVRNLILMANACAENIDLLVLMYWTLQVRKPMELRTACRVAERGFRSKGCQFGPASCPILLLETIVRPGAERLTVESFVAKQFIFGGENKHYVAEGLNMPSAQDQMEYTSRSRAASS